MENIVSLVIAGISGGGLGFYLNYLISNRQTDQSEFQIILETWKAENRDLKEREEKNSAKIDELRKDMQRLRDRIVILSIGAGVSAEAILKDLYDNHEDC